ncbi:hypothetical protein ACWD26_00695 [Streptomyces sp. NPDC002787]
MSNSGIALAGLRSWAQRLHNCPADEGVYVGLLCIGVPITPGAGEGDPHVLADRWYQLAQDRHTFGATIGIWTPSPRAQPDPAACGCRCAGLTAAAPVGAHHMLPSSIRSGSRTRPAI